MAFSPSPQASCATSLSNLSTGSRFQQIITRLIQNSKRPRVAADSGEIGDPPQGTEPLGFKPLAEPLELSGWRASLAKAQI
mmetsp:Transcript_44274/g.69244  ORF Transcript_44274/g.69244 Transcript_44274/m.69244 type:complete len:81 (+) Transcript_44274:165-407(+)